MGAYHDEEWGVPLHGDQELFAKLVLDGFQAGLSWAVVLHKRDGLLGFRFVGPTICYAFMQAVGA